MAHGQSKAVCFLNQTEVRHNLANLIPWIMEVIRREYNVQTSKIGHTDKLDLVVL